ncbi:MAG: hypothetical protein K6E87_04595, partial [bacterium]|nr:hypothetical protein [bacterium]
GYKNYENSSIRYLTYNDFNINSNSDGDNSGIAFNVFYVPNNDNSFIYSTYRYVDGDNWLSFSFNYSRLNWFDNDDGHGNYNEYEIEGYTLNNQYYSFSSLQYNLVDIDVNDYYYLNAIYIRTYIDGVENWYYPYMKWFEPSDFNIVDGKYYFTSIDEFQVQTNILADNIVLPNYSLSAVQGNLDSVSYGNVYDLLYASEVSFTTSDGNAVTNNDLVDVFALLLQAFDSVVPLLNIQIFAGITLATLFLIPLMVSIIILIFKAISK